MKIDLLDSTQAEGHAITLQEGEIQMPSGDRMMISQEALHDHLGWDLKPEGLCEAGGDLCVPVRDRAALVQDERIDLAEFAKALGRPVVIDRDAGVAALGTARSSRSDAMTSLVAPDFELPDLAGRMHTLSEHRGKKVLLIAYASW